MLLFGDYHTHTKFSHGKNTILENAVSAKNKGIKEIAITDHGYGHLLYGVKRKNVPEMKKQIEEAKKITGLNIYYGVEANFTSLDGTIDVTEKEYEDIEILLVGHHRFVKAKRFIDIFKLFLPNMLLSKFKPSEKRIERNTQTILNAMDKYKIDILTHLNYGFPVDVARIAKKAKEKNVLIELNGRKVCFSDEEMKVLLDSGVKFVVDSDAHKSKNVGCVPESINYIEKYNIPVSRIVNMDKLPVTTKIRRKI